MSNKPSFIRRAGRAFTLAEAMIAVVILATAAAAVILPFSGGAAMRAEGYNRTVAARLAADMLEKISRTDFNSIISMYNGYTEAQGQLKDQRDAVISSPIYTYFSRAVTCEEAKVNGVPGVSLVWATVDVYYRGGEIVKVSTLIGPE